MCCHFFIMKARFLLFAVILSGALLTSCGSKGPKSNEDLDPVDRIEALSNEISTEGSKWTKENWDDAADILESAIAELPNPLSEEEGKIVSAAVSRMQVYADRQKRKASGVIEVLSSFAAPEAAQAEAPAAPAAPAPAAAPAPTPAPAVAPSGLLSGSVIREGGYTNVRQGPGTNYSVVTKIKDGSSIFYTVHNANWCKVYNSSGQMLGYMHSSKVVPAGGNVAPSPSRGTSSGTPYDWLAQRKVTHGDLAGLSSGQLRILRNAIYARHGRRFKDASLRQFFNQQSWYNGYRDEIPERELNSIEKYNINMIKSYE